jgi:hypothetical protein
MFTQLYTDAEHADIGARYAASLGARGLLHVNRTPTPVGFRPMHKPRAIAAQQQRDEADGALRAAALACDAAPLSCGVAAGGVASRRAMAVERVPYCYRLSMFGVKVCFCRCVYARALFPLVVCRSQLFFFFFFH